MLQLDDKFMILSPKTGSRWILKILKERGWYQHGDNHHDGPFHLDPHVFANFYPGYKQACVTIRDPRDVMLSFFWQEKENRHKAEGT